MSFRKEEEGYGINVIIQQRMNEREEYTVYTNKEEVDITRKPEVVIRD